MTAENQKEPGVNSLLKRSYELFEKGDFNKAQVLLNEAHKENYDNLELLAALRVCGYWISRVRRLDDFHQDGAKGDYLCRQWRKFVSTNISELEVPFNEGLSRLRNWVFGTALACYEHQAGGDNPDTEVLLLAGRCQKTLGWYAKAIKTFEKALKIERRGSAPLLAELADVYALTGEVREAKVLFREALYKDPLKVDTTVLESPLICLLVKKLEEEKNYRGGILNEWLPVYGVLWGVLDVKRELLPVEYGKLKQSIYALKSEIADGDQGGYLKPRLINRYFWLIDYYQQTGKDRQEVEEALMSIKLLSPAIYRLYTRNE